jgi:hypothetical protein
MRAAHCGAAKVMGWPPKASFVPRWSVEFHLRKASMEEVVTIGSDVAKHVFMRTGRASGAGRY